MMDLSGIFQDPLKLHFMTALLMAWPVARIFRRSGFSPLWAGLLAVPFLGIILVAGALALRRWPVLPAKEKEK